MSLSPGITLIEASAGTGKTYQIAEIFVRLVTELGLPVEEILVVTFTEAATAELRSRIRARLLEKVPEASEEADQRRRRALEGFDEAAISTIHGFCNRVLQESAFESGAELDAELVADVVPLLAEIVADFWTRETHDATPPLINGLAARRITLSDLLDLARAVSADADAVVVPLVSVAGDALDGPLAVWRAAWSEARESWRSSGRDAVALAATAIDAGDLNRRTFKPEKLRSWAIGIDGAFGSGSSDAVALTEGMDKLSATALASGAKKGRIPPAHPVFDCLATLCAAHADLSTTLDASALDLKHRLVAFVRAELDQRKRARNLRTYDDLLRHLQVALADPARGPALTDALRRRFKAALIDEFQDTDPVQWDIFHRAFGHDEGRLYLIGDPKQAIYGFRGADIHTYLDARTTSTRQQTLEKNWRTDAPLVAAVNRIFGRDALREPFGGEDIAFKAVDAAHAEVRVTGAGAPFEIRFVRRDELNVAKRGWGITKAWAGQALPRLVANDIVRFLARGPRFDADHPVTPRDLAVLVRTNHQAREVQAALREAGVPSVLHGAENVLHTREAAELTTCLVAALDPSRAASVKAALATDLVGVSGNALAEMEHDEKAWESWLAIFRELGATWEARGFLPMFRALDRHCELGPRLLAWSDGERRMTNVLHLAELLHRAASEQRLKPAGLVAWLEVERGAAGVDDEARMIRLEGDADAVELATLHGSKGLEYPFVWCPYLWDGALLRRNALRHLRYFDRVVGQRRIDIDLDPHSPGRQVAKTAAEREVMAENLRLLYVALTRAEHGCTVYWGAFASADTSPLGHVLHPGGALKTLDDAALRASLDDLAGGSGDTIVVSEATAGEPTSFTPERAAHAEPRARCARDGWLLDTTWRRSSFSELARGGHQDPRAPAPQKDRDEATGTAEPLITSAEARRVPLSDLEAGPRTGTCLHAVLELHDLSAGRAALREHVERQLRQHGFDPGAWTERVTDALDEALRTPLQLADGPCCLAEIPVADTVRELDFDFPLATSASRGATPTTLAALYRAHGAPELAERFARLDFAPLRGFMTGSIDLIFRRGARCYLIDYKSNHLGPTPADYAAPRLFQAMLDHVYHLQGHIYAVALDRFLRWRMPGYDRATHFGGIGYLFLRGMRPETGTSGVFFHRPPDALITGLSDLLEQGEGGAP